MCRLGLSLLLAVGACTPRARSHPSSASVRAGPFAIVASAQLDRATDTARVIVHLRNEATRVTGPARVGYVALSFGVEFGWFGSR